MKNTKIMAVLVVLLAAMLFVGAASAGYVEDEDDFANIAANVDYLTAATNYPFEIKILNETALDDTNNVNVTVDWGDGKLTTDIELKRNGGNEYNATVPHTYDKAGTYNVLLYNASTLTDTTQKKTLVTITVVDAREVVNGDDVFVYEHIIYAPNVHIAAASLPGMFDHTITCNSLSKTYSITGWRLGYLIGPENVIEAAKKVHDFLTVGAAAPLQEAAVAGLTMPESYYEELGALYTEKRDYFLEGLDRIGLKHNVPQGSYFVLVDIQDFLDLPQFSGWTDLQFCEWMVENIGVAAVPGSSFFRENVNNLIRLHFARSKETLDQALERLSKLKDILS